MTPTLSHRKMELGSLTPHLQARKTMIMPSLPSLLDQKTITMSDIEQTSKDLHSKFKKLD